jgi:hypothetical protein
LTSLAEREKAFLHVSHPGASSSFSSNQHQHQHQLHESRPSARASLLLPLP